MLFEYLKQLIADVFWLTDDVLKESQKHKAISNVWEQEWIQRGGWKVAGMGEGERLHEEESQLGRAQSSAVLPVPLGEGVREERAMGHWGATQLLTKVIWLVLKASLMWLPFVTGCTVF